MHPLEQQLKGGPSACKGQLLESQSQHILSAMLQAIQRFGS